MNDQPEDPVDRLLNWLDKHVTEQTAIGCQPIAIIVLIASILLVVGWCANHVRPAIH